MRKKTRRGGEPCHSEISGVVRIKIELHNLKHYIRIYTWLTKRIYKVTDKRLGISGHFWILFIIFLKVVCGKKKIIINFFKRWYKQRPKKHLKSIKK